MKANELRIGNWINRDSENEELRLWHFYKIAECVFDEDDLKPIPLTEEWLLKFGFKKIGGTIYKNIGSIEIGLTGKRFYIQIRCENITIQNIKHVHQLQNLYFALTNQEL